MEEVPEDLAKGFGVDAGEPGGVNLFIEDEGDIVAVGLGSK